MTIALIIIASALALPAFFLLWALTAVATQAAAKRKAEAFRTLAETKNLYGHLIND